MRVNKITLIAGTRGTGKTDFCKNLLSDVSKNFPKTLILDTFDNPAWRNLSTWDNPNRLDPIPVLPAGKFSLWKKGLARMYSSNINELIQSLDKSARNTVILFEDATRFIGSKITDDLKKIVLDSKQKNLDIIFVFHSLMSIPPDLVRVSDILILFKTNEGAPSKDKYPWGEIPEMMKRLKASKNRYAYEILLLN